MKKIELIKLFKIMHIHISELNDLNIEFIKNFGKAEIDTYSKFSGLICGKYVRLHKYNKLRDEIVDYGNKRSNLIKKLNKKIGGFNKRLKCKTKK